MKKEHVFYSLSNFIAFLLLAALISAPFYFAKKSTSVAGVKTEAAYLIISQVEKFPGMEFSQKGQTYSLNLPASADAYIGVLILTNPSKETKAYKLESENVFFGENLDDQLTSILLPAGTSIPLSVLSNEDQKIEFEIQ